MLSLYVEHEKDGNHDLLAPSDMESFSTDELLELQRQLHSLLVAAENALEPRMMWTRHTSGAGEREIDYIIDGDGDQWNSISGTEMFHYSWGNLSDRTKKEIEANHGIREVVYK